MKIFLADDQREVRWGLRILLEQENETDIAGEASELTEMLVEAQKIQPDMLLLDWELSNVRMSDIIPVLRKLCPKTKILVMSGRPEAQSVAMSAGVDGFLSKGDQPEKVIEAINNVFGRGEG
ncbi:MAG: response regulator transcription factor [Clostridia bacterium]|nr:response regulator transcription factor [Clostridia bacterium]